jgi:hypothetical protein
MPAPPAGHSTGAVLDEAPGHAEQNRWCCPVLAPGTGPERRARASWMYWRRMRPRRAARRALPHLARPSCSQSIADHSAASIRVAPLNQGSGR